MSVQTDQLLLILLTTGLLLVLVLTAASLWVLLTILFQLRRAIEHIKKPKTLAGIGLGLAAWLVGDKVKRK